MNKNYSKSILSLLTSKFSTKFRLVLMVLFVVVTPLVSFGQTEIFTRSGTFTVPCDVTSITVKVWGAGGGGHNSNNYGGGGGAFAQSSFSVASGNVYAITVGSGAGSGTGDNGGDSSFANVVVAKGGKGGSFENGGQASASTGDIKFNGGNGGKSTGNAGAGGGAGAGISSDGNSGGSTINTTAGSGGLGINGGGSGGNGGTNSNSGSNGFSPGGGGGERGKNGGSSGGGGDGRIEVIYTSSIKAYCTPSYNGAVEPITNVTFAGINNTTTNITGGPSLELFCSPSASVIQGSAINAISVKGNTVGNYTEYIKAYVDWDQNGVFGNSTNEIFDLGTITNSTGIDAKFSSGNIAVPATAIIGSTTMRVVKTYFSNGVNSNNPCFSGNDWGQAEDYIINVISPLPVITSLGASSGCVGSSVTINGRNLSGATATTVKIGGTAVTSITSISETQIVAVIGSGTTGSITVTTPSGTATSSSVFTVNPPSVGGTISGGTTVCSGTNSTVLTLAGHTGTVVRWESSLDNFATAGSAIANTSTTLIATNLSATTSFRAVLQSGSCSIANSSSATVTVNPPSVGGTVSGGATVCSGVNSTVLTLAGDTGTVVRWESSLDNFATAGSTIANTNTTLTATNLSTTTSYRAVLQSGSCSIVNSSSATVTVNPPSVGGTVSGGATVCSGVNSTVLTLAGDTGTVVRWESSLDNFATAGSTIANTNTTLTATNLSTTTSYRAVLQSGSCSIVNSSSATVTVNLPSVGGTVSGGATVCSGINSTVLTLAGETGTVVRWESSLDNFATAGSTIANTSTTLTVTNLSASTSYRAVLQSGVCAAATSGTVTVMVETNTWKVILGVAQWEKGTPNINQSIVFEANYNQNVNLEGCSCEVKSGTITIIEGKTMTLTNELKVSGGTLTFQNNASLVQINDVSNAGAITYERRTETAIDKFDYTYWSSPVSSQTLKNVSPNTLWDKYMSFDAVTNNWKVENSITKVMEPGVGYSIRGPQNYYAPNPPNPFPASFIGVPHNGTIEVPITATNASYLLGNPYPSALDADAFLTNNAGVIDGTIYFWTHVTDIAPSGSQYIYNSDDYATYNLTGGVGTDNKEYPKGGVESISGSTKPTGKIASGQGFFATGIAAGNVEFKNAMRVGIGGITGENIQFFRTKNSKSKVTSSTIEKNRVWLNLTNTEGAFKQLLVGYITGATNEYDTSYDGFSFSLNEYINFYSIVANEAMAIQGRALPFDENDLVPLGYSSAIVGDFSIGIDEVDGAMQSQNVFLEDKMLDIIHNLKESSYNFTTEKGVFNERFVLRYTDKTLGTGDFESQEKIIVVFKEKNELKIKSEFETMKRVTVFDLLGKKVFEETLKDVNEFHTSNITLKNQIVIVKVVLTNGQVVAKKVSY